MEAGNKFKQLTTLRGLHKSRKCVEVTKYHHVVICISHRLYFKIYFISNIGIRNLLSEINGK